MTPAMGAFSLMLLVLGAVPVLVTFLATHKVVLMVLLCLHTSSLGTLA